MTAIGKPGHRNRSVQPKTTRTVLPGLRIDDNKSRKSLSVYLFLSNPPFALLGLHKFYLGKIWQGIAFLLPAIFLMKIDIICGFLVASIISVSLLSSELKKHKSGKIPICDSDGRRLS